MFVIAAMPRSGRGILFTDLISVLSLTAQLESAESLAPQHWADAFLVPVGKEVSFRWKKNFKSSLNAAQGLQTERLPWGEKRTRGKQSHLAELTNIISVLSFRSLDKSWENNPEVLFPVIFSELCIFCYGLMQYFE